MGLAEQLLSALDFAMRETALFAASGFLLLGIGDLLVDAIWIGGSMRRLVRGAPSPTIERLPEPQRPGPLAIFIPAWDEAPVIGIMLRHTLATLDHEDYRLYVGCYPNDPETIAEVERVADTRVRMVVGSAPGPTNKADCLNRLWEQMRADEAAGIM